MRCVWIVILVVGCAKAPSEPAIDPMIELDQALADCPGASVHSFRVDPFLRSIVALQNVGFERATERLVDMAVSNRDEDGKVIALCRLLFVAKPGFEFRRAGIGGVGFMGDTRYVDWALDPFEVVDGVPFVITDGTLEFSGTPASSWDYVKYCYNECQWNSIKYVPRNKQQKERALLRLLGTMKWKRPLTLIEKDMLRAQIVD